MKLIPEHYKSEQHRNRGKLKKQLAATFQFYPLDVSGFSVSIFCVLLLF